MVKSFTDLTHLGQVRRLGELARLALTEYELADSKMQLIFHGENTTFRVDATEARTGPDDLRRYNNRRFLLRVHRIGYQTREEIASELTWLGALRSMTSLVVPEPLQTRSGDPIASVSVPGLPEGRHCSLLRWIDGRFMRKNPRPVHFWNLGKLMAALHDQAVNWNPPAGFRRRSWDWDGLFGDNAGVGMSGDRVWSLMPTKYRSLFEPIADRVRGVIKRLGDGPEAVGLIHADLHLDNVLFKGAEAASIDFDDCGYGNWIYDFAVSLGDVVGEGEYGAFRDSLLGGYSECRPLPEGLLDHLDTFIAGRLVSLGIWLVGRAEDNPRFREKLDLWLGQVAGDIEQTLSSNNP